MANNDSNRQAAAASDPNTAAAQAKAKEQLKAFEASMGRLADKLAGVPRGDDEMVPDVAVRVIGDLTKSNRTMLGEVKAAEAKAAEAVAQADAMRRELVAARASGKAAGPVKARFMKP